MADATAKHDLTDLRTKLFFGFGSVAGGVKDTGIIGLLMLFYYQVVGLPAATVSLAMGIALVCDAIFDPIIGEISDNWRSRWGRRHPFMYAAIVPIGICYALLWNPPHWSQGDLFVYLLAMLIATRLCMSMYEIPASSLIPELTSDYHKRTDLVSYRYFFGYAGAIASTLLAFLVFLVPDATHKIGQLNPAGYPGYGMVAGALISFSMLVAALGTHRHIKYLSVPPKYRPTIVGMAKEMASTLGNKMFVVVLSCCFVAAIAAGLVAAMGTTFNTFFWKLNNVQFSYFAYITVLAGVLGFFIAVPLLKRFDKKHGAIGLMICGMVIGSLQFVPTIFFGWDPNPATEAFLVPALLANFFIIATIAFAVLVLTGSMINDVVEAHAVKTGRRQEGVFQSAAGLITKITTGVGVFLSGIILSFVHFPQHADPHMLDPEIMRHVLYIYMPILLLLHLTAILILSRYSLTQEQHEENVRRLAEEAARASNSLDLGEVVAGAPIPAERLARSGAAKPAAAAGE